MQAAGSIHVGSQSDATRYFLCREDVAYRADDQKTIQQAFEEAFRRAKLFEDELNQKSQYLHQRKAQVGAIAQVHARYKAELERNHDEMQGQITRVRSLYKSIARLDDPRQMSQAFLQMITFEVNTPGLLQRYIDLTLLLESAHHTDALEFYKQGKRQCKVLKKIANPEQRVDGLAHLVAQVEAKISEVTTTLSGKAFVIVGETAALYEELLAFIAYTASRFHPDAAAESSASSTSTDDDHSDKEGSYSLLGRGWTYAGVLWTWATAAPELPVDTQKIEHRLAELTAKVESLLQLFTATFGQAKLAPLVSQEDQHAVSIYIQSRQGDVLRYEDDFRNGQWGATTPYIGRYLGIADHIEALRGVSKALVAIIDAIKLHTSRLYEPGGEVVDVRKYEKLIDGLENRIYMQQADLKRLPFSNQVHAGWYYVAKLIAKAAEVRLYFGYYKKLAADRFAPYARAVRHIAGYLDMANSTNHAAAMRLFWSAVQDVCLLQNPLQGDSFRKKICALIYETSDQILARVGPRHLVPSEGDAQLCQNILGRVYFAKEAQEVNSEALLVYLLKRLLGRNHFLQQEIDPELELILFTCQNIKFYKNYFTNSLEELSPLIENFVVQCDIQSNRQLLRGMANVCFLLSSSLSYQNRSYGLFAYCEARQILSEIHVEQQGILENQRRLDWLEKRTAPLRKTIEGDYYPTYYSHFERIDPAVETNTYAALFKLAVVALYASTDALSVEASNQLIEYLKRVGVDGLPHNSFTQKVLQAWCLERFVAAREYSTPCCRQLLRDLFFEYLSRQSERSSWIDQYGVGFMETALCRLAQMQENDAEVRGYQNVYNLVRIRRKDDGYELWKAAISFYEQYTGLTGDDRQLLAKAMLDELGDVVVFDGEIAVDTYIDVARWCYRELCKNEHV